MSKNKEISQVYICKNIKDVKKLISYVKETKICSFDFETDGNPYYEPYSYPTILGVSFQVGSAWIIPLGHFDSPFKDNYQEVLKLIGRELMEDIDITKIAHNAEFEYQWMKKYGVHIKGRLFDTMLAKYLLDENTLNSLSYLIDRFLPEYSELKNQEDSELKGIPWDEKPLIPLSKYCGGDCDTTLQLWNFFEPILIKKGFYNLYRNLLSMGTRVLGDATFEGVEIDKEYLDKLVEDTQGELNNLLNDVKNHRKVRVFDKARIADAKEKLITEVEVEISEIKAQFKKEKKLLGGDEKAKAKKSRDRKIANRELKIARYTLGDFTTKKEMACIEPFNIASVKQLKELLFDHRKGFRIKPLKFTIKREGRRKIQTDNPSTDEEALLMYKEKDKSGFIDLLLEYRSLSKLFGTYILGMQNKLSSNGKIHGRFLLHGTVTGRLSSRSPNLQNIPRDTTSSSIKKMFIPPPGHLFFQLDYSQAELRVLAAAAGEETMIEWFKTGKDIHLATACDKYNEDYDKIIKIYSNENHPEYKDWKIKRKQAKTINFGIVYGQGAKALASTLSEPSEGIIISTEEATKFLKDFNHQFPMVSTYISKIHKKLKKDGYVSSVWGRKRRLDGIWSNEFGIRAKAERDAINAPIQGAASDYALFSSILIYEKIQAQEGVFKDLKYRMTVHDSLIYYVKPQDIHELVPKLEAICANPKTKEFFNFQIDGVYMKVDFEVGVNWGELKGYNPDEDYTKWL